MAEVLAREIAKLHHEVQSLQAQLQGRPAATTKDLSLVPLVPKWAGTSRSISVQEFFDTVIIVAVVVKWMRADKIRITTLKLTDTARTFYNTTSEFHAEDITWSSYKDIFLRRLKDTWTDQFHFCQLQTARQRKDESPQI
jgi:predicted PolB exonuclease-like 3'-5' exonuclease